jgi:hypothetical protein
MHVFDMAKVDPARSQPYVLFDILILILTFWSKPWLI